MGIGWRLTRREGRLLAWSHGNGGGVRAFMGLAPGDKAGVVAFANMTTSVGVDDIGLHVLDKSQPVDVAPIPVRMAIVVAVEILDRYVGTYVYAPGDSLTIERAGEGLALVLGGSRLALFAESETLFFLREDNVTLEFDELESGRAATLTLTQAGQVYVYRRTP